MSSTEILKAAACYFSGGSLSSLKENSPRWCHWLLGLSYYTFFFTFLHKAWATNWERLEFTRQRGFQGKGVGNVWCSAFGVYSRRSGYLASFLSISSLICLLWVPEFMKIQYSVTEITLSKCASWDQNSQIFFFSCVISYSDSLNGFLKGELDNFFFLNLSLSNKHWSHIVLIYIGSIQDLLSLSYSVCQWPLFFPKK